MLDSKIPAGSLENKWNDYKGHVKLVNPANKRKLEIIIVGTGLAGASAAAALGELGYKVKAFCFQDSPRRAHSIAAKGDATNHIQQYNKWIFENVYHSLKKVMIIFTWDLFQPGDPRRNPEMRNMHDKEKQQECTK